MRTIALLLLLVLPVTANSPMQFAPFMRTSVAGGGGGGADLTENFEGAGYENSWTESFGTPVEDQDTTGLSLEASECLWLASSSVATETYVNFTASDNAYVYCMFRIEDLPSAADRSVFKFSTAGSDDVAITLNTAPTAFKAWSAGEDQNDLGGSSLSADTTYHVWFEYQKGTGANATIRLFFATTGTKPGTAECEITTADDTHQVSRLHIGVDWAGSGANFYVDKLRLSRTTAFGSDPS